MASPVEFVSGAPAGFLRYAANSPELQPQARTSASDAGGSEARGAAGSREAVADSVELSAAAGDLVRSRR